MATLPVNNPAFDLPRPDALESLDYEALQAEFMASFRAEWPAYDVYKSEFDPVLPVSEAFASVRELDRARVNDAFRATLLALATKNDLTQRAADLGLTRRIYMPATDNFPAVQEIDDELRVRCWTQIQRWARGGTNLGMEGAAWSLALPDAADIRVYDFPGKGRMRCVLLPEQSLSDSSQAEMLARVSQGVMRRDTRFGSVPCDAALADIIPLDLKITLGLLRGSSETSVKMASRDAVVRYFAKGRRIGNLVALSRVEGEACVTNVQYAHVTGMSGDLQATQNQAYELRTLSVLSDRDPT